MKHIREMAKASRASKLARFCGGGDVARVKNGMPARDGEPKGYAHGGMVGGGMAEGMPAKPRLDRGGHMKKPGKAAKAGTHVNVVVMPHSGGGAPPPDAGAMPPMPPGGPGPAMPPMPPPGAGAGAGGPPMPMGGGMPGQKHGGKVGRYAKGGKVHRAHGGDVSDGLNDDYAEDDRAAKKHGGKVGKKMASGGKLPVPMDAGAGSGEGREEKAERYGKGKK